MIFAFKKLSGKTLTVLSIVHIFHVEKNIQFRFNQYQSLEVLEVNKQQKIHGFYSIINFLTNTIRTPQQNEKLWWLAFQFQETLQVKKPDGTVLNKKLVKNDNLKTLNKILEQSPYIEGPQMSEADVIAYMKIKPIIGDLKSYGKINQWFKGLATTIEPIIEQCQTQFKAEKKQEKVPQKQAQQKPQQQEKKAEEPKGIKQEQPKKAKAVKEEITPEYQQKIDGLRFSRLNKGQPILPDNNRRNILITSALPYVNNVPHLGNIIGCVLSADAYARFCRLRGYNTLYICGTDEYGTATEVKAIQEGTTPQAICDKYFKLHDEIYKWFDIDFDYFGRTSTPVHTEITQDIFNHLNPKFTTQQTKDQTHCSNCEMFLADRYVLGQCPHCKFEEATGDQCDHCGKLLDPVDLINPQCWKCKKTPQLKETSHVYINLPKIQPALEQWLYQAAEKGQWSQNSLQMSKGWLKKGLLERCITRDLKWGVPVPLEEFKQKVFYVWFDAPIGYLSITANFLKDWKQWWLNPENVQLYQFMGKDNVPFHTVIFPSTLIGTEQKYTMLHHISTTEYLNYEDGKFSKSRGIGVFGDNIKNTGLSADIFRYYLLVNRPEKADSVFIWKDFGDKNNNELLPNLGNLVNRALKFVYSNYNKTTPIVAVDQLKQNDIEFIQQFIGKFTNEYVASFEKVEIKDSLKKAMELSSMVNKYLQDEKPWDQEQRNNKRSDAILSVAMNAIRVVSAAIEPFMPQIAGKINYILGFEVRTKDDDVIIEKILSHPDPVKALMNLVPQGQKLNQPISLFRTFTDDEVISWKNLYSGQQK